MSDKLDPLPWFAFNIGDYVKDTMRLTTEAHGAYLLLMLDYYGTGAPCPDDDYVLAAVTKLPEERWKQVRRALQPLFDVREGHWYHSRIEREMREACAKHAASIAAAKAGAAARWAVPKGTEVVRAGRRHRNTTDEARNAVRNAPAVPEALPPAMPEQSEPIAHLHIHPLITGGEEAPPAKVVDVELEVGPVPTDFTPDPATSDRARAAGMTVAEIDAEVRKFVIKRRGQLGDDWQGSFALWIEREIAHRAKQVAKAPPRIEVNNAPYVPTEAETERALVNFSRGIPWSHKTFGPEPGMYGCRISPALFEKLGLDPTTGMKRRAVS